MFIIRVHSVDQEECLAIDGDGWSETGPAILERRGVVHLFRSTSSQSFISNPSSSLPSSSLFVVAAPNYLSAPDFIRFCASHIQHLSRILFIRNDAMEDRYSVLVKAVDQAAADSFYGALNGKQFSPGEAEICHILYTQSVEFTEFAQISSTPPSAFTELPSCPICLERLDPDTSGILSTLCDHSFQCSCTAKWTYLSCAVCRLCQQHDQKPACSVCGTLEDVWACLICGFTGCGRYKEGHAVRHWKDTQHCYSLDLRTQQIWDYVGDSYVHRLNQSKADGKSAGTKAQCLPLGEECGAYEFSDDSGISGAIFNSKVDSIVDEYNHLLATQLETQRQHYESLLTEAKSKREVIISEAVDHALTSQMHDIQIKHDKCMKEKDVVAEINRNLMKAQETWRQMVKETEDREISQSRLKDEMIHDLEEQIRDLKVYIEAQKTLSDLTDSQDVRGGTLLPVPEQQSSSPRRHKKTGRRRN